VTSRLGDAQHAKFGPRGLKLCPGSRAISFPSLDETPANSEWPAAARNRPSGLNAGTRGNSDAFHGELEGRGIPEHLGDKDARLLAVSRLEAGRREGQGLGRVVCDPELREREKPTGLAAPLGSHGLLAGNGDHPRHADESHERGRDGGAHQPLAPADALGHRPGEILLERCQLARIPLPPQLVLAEGRA
jgi:hypothetical protein